MNRGLKIIPPSEDDESNVFERPKVEAKARQSKPGYGRRLDESPGSCGILGFESVEGAPVDCQPTHPVRPGRRWPVLARHS